MIEIVDTNGDFYSVSPESPIRHWPFGKGKVMFSMFEASKLQNLSQLTAHREQSIIEAWLDGEWVAIVPAEWKYTTILMEVKLKVRSTGVAEDLIEETLKMGNDIEAELHDFFVEGYGTIGVAIVDIQAKVV